MSILNRSLENDKIKSVDGSMLITSKYTAGIGNERFLRKLQENEEIIGSYCPKCNKSFLPARHFCERCLTRLEENRVAPREGILASHTEVTIDLDGNPLPSPKRVGLVTFKGFEGGIIHTLSAKDPKKIRIGAKVRALFKPKAKRTGSILDIECFEPV
ncbi:MAG: Zn-ribbon domain-containing OB-fold protein [Deltaproteobacteria bacterium]